MVLQSGHSLPVWILQFGRCIVGEKSAWILNFGNNIVDWGSNSQWILEFGRCGMDSLFLDNRVWILKYG